MFCGECGAQNPDTNKFCNNCGKPLERAAGQVPAGAVFPAQQPAAAPVQQVPAAAPAGKQRNWMGGFSIVLGIVSWLAYPYLLGTAAIVLGFYSAYRISNATGKIAILSVAGIAIAAGSMVYDNFYYVLFPVDISDMSYLGSGLILHLV